MNGFDIPVVSETKHLGTDINDINIHNLKQAIKDLKVLMNFIN